ncbi:hypothetical protein D7V86_24605 [bacterium D16-51]|nr:hypothetical protein D7V96_25115 [bacterium D16-59]RKI53802.1 hypothetical protein D7V86_24605 [bacterium D16-51]
MRETNVTKTKAKTTIKPVTNLPESNSKLDTSSQTPIEIALKIDENGMTTASNLYAFLELDSTHFSRWCNKNIANSKFATENKDYFPFTTEGERYNPKPKTDYKITSEFAKKLSMTGNTERHEQARQYFIACEQGLKIAAQKLQSIPDNSINEKLIELLASMDNRLSMLEEQSGKKKLPEKKYSRWKNKTFRKLNTLLAYVNENSDDELSLPNIIHLVIGETEDIYNLEINEYVDLYRCEFSIDPGTKVQVLDTINHYKDIRDMFTLTLDSIMEKLHIAENTGCNKQRNIFDELAAKTEKD